MLETYFGNNYLFATEIFSLIFFTILLFGSNACILLYEKLFLSYTEKNQRNVFDEYANFSIGWLKILKYIRKRPDIEDTIIRRMFGKILFWEKIAQISLCLLFLMVFIIIFSIQFILKR